MFFDLARSCPMFTIRVGQNGKTLTFMLSNSPRNTFSRVFHPISILVFIAKCRTRYFRTRYRTPIVQVLVQYIQVGFIAKCRTRYFRTRYRTRTVQVHMIHSLVVVFLLLVPGAGRHSVLVRTVNEKMGGGERKTRKSKKPLIGQKTTKESPSLTYRLYVPVSVLILRISRTFTRTFFLGDSFPSLRHFFRLAGDCFGVLVVTVIVTELFILISDVVYFGIVIQTIPTYYGTRSSSCDATTRIQRKRLPLLPLSISLSSSTLLPSECFHLLVQEQQQGQRGTSTTKIALKVIATALRKIQYHPPLRLLLLLRLLRRRIHQRRLLCHPQKQSHRMS